MSRRFFSDRAVRPWTLGAAAVLTALMLSTPSVAQSPAASIPAAGPSVSAARASDPDREGRRPRHQMERRHADVRGHHGDSRRDSREFQGDPVERVIQRMAHLKIDLKITSAQEKAWQAYVAQATRLAEARKAREAKRPAAEAVARMSTPDRRSLRTEEMKHRVEDQEAMNKVFKSLYAVLTPEQQALADRHTAPRSGKRGPGRDR